MKAINRLLFTALCLSLIVGLYFFSCNPSKDSTPMGAKVSAEAISAAQGDIVTTFQHREKDLKAKNDSLVLKITKGQRDLATLRRQVRDLKFSLSEMLSDTIPKDTAQMIADCSELKTQATDLVVLTGTQDSLCEQTISQYEDLVAVKDTMIQNCMHRTFQTDSLLSLSLETQRQLEAQFRAQAKELGQRRRAVNLLSAGLLVFSTSSLILLLTRQQ